MRQATKQSKITADFFAGNITAKRAAKIAKRAKRAAINRGRKSKKVWK